jgi:hypothetical protein
MSYASPCTGINSIAEEKENKKRRTRNSNKNNSNNTIEIGKFRLPGGLAGRYIFSDICKYLDIRSLLNFMETSLIKQLTKECGSDNFKEIINDIKQPVKRLYLLIERYKSEFPRGTPIVCACQRGRMDDVELFMNLHPFHKYITNRDVNDHRDDMTLGNMVNQVGTDISGGYEYTPLMAAARYEHFQMVQYLIEQCEAGPTIADRYGQSALHLAAGNNRTNTELIDLLLTHMTLDNINKKTSRWVYTPLDCVYSNNHSPIRQEIIALIRSKGGKANSHDENGRYAGAGYGDLNH